MKCPRCQHEVRPEDHYCPHCGYDLRSTTHVTPFRFPLLPVLAIILAAFIFPLASILLVSNGNELWQQEENDRITISSLSENNGREGVYHFDSLKEFESKVTNANVFIDPVKTYTTSLNKEYDTRFKTTYDITVYTDNDVLMNITETANIDKQRTITINRVYDRAKTQDDITITFTKTGCKTFTELTLEDESQYTDKIIGQKDYQALLKIFMIKEADFNKKKDRIGHYGIGAYRKKSSLVLYQDGDTYKAVLLDQTTGDHELVR